MPLAAVRRASRWTRNLSLRRPPSPRSVWINRCLWAVILHALRALDSWSFHLWCSVLWLLNLEAFTYELGTVRVPGVRSLKLWLETGSKGWGGLASSVASEKLENLQQEFELRPRPDKLKPRSRRVRSRRQVMIKVKRFLLKGNSKL